MLDTNSGDGIVVQGKGKEDPKVEATDVAITKNIDLAVEPDKQNAGIGISKDKGIELPSKPNIKFPEEMQDGTNSNSQKPTEQISEAHIETPESDDNVDEEVGAVEEPKEEEVPDTTNKIIQVEKEEETKEDAVQE